MKLKQTMRYHLHDFTRASIIYYLVIASLILLSFILKAALSLEHFTLGGLDSSSAIFLFVLGLNAFKSQFGLFIQNGISRRTLVVDFLLSALLISFGVALVDNILPLLLRTSLNYSSVFMSTYYPMKTYAFSITGLAWTMLANMAAMCCGFFLTTLFYRMNKPLKVLVSAGIPLLIFVGLPLAEVFIPSFNFYQSALKFYLWAMGMSFFGIGAVSPLRALVSLSVVSVVMAALAYLLVRRATLKEA